MTINGTNISTFNAKQRTVAINSHNAINGDSEWQKAAPLPYLSNQYVQMKSFTVTLWVYGADREAICKNCSDILGHLLVPVDLSLDNITHKFRGVLTGHRETENAVNRWHILELNFVGYEYHANDLAFTGISSVVVSNPGNIVSPAAVEITPTIGAASITLTGICRDSYTGVDLPVTINTLTANKKVRLDTLTGLITEDGAPKDVDIWRMPSFVPGNTTVTCNNSNMSILVVLRPLYI